MRKEEFIEAVSNAYKRVGSKNVRKFRCKSGPRKGRVMASPASCNAPINSKKRASLTKTKSRLGKQRSFTSKLTTKRNPSSRRLKTLNR
jgi:hypothetical protein